MLGQSDAMTQRVNVLTCNLRRDGQHLVTYRVGSSVYSALSPKPVQPGTDVRVRDGKVIG